MPISEKRLEGARYGGQIGLIIEALADVYTGPQALDWIVSPQSLLENRRPSELLLTPEGSAEVVKAVSQIQDSVHV